MKRLKGLLSAAGFSGLLVVSLVGSAVRVSAATPFSGDGDGTSGSPYQITSCDQLEEIQDNLSASYVLANSVDCTNTIMDPIGTPTTAFTGTLDGKGNTISNVSIGGLGADDGGIFGVTQNATITDVRLDSVSVRGNNNVGALAGLTTYTTFSHIAGTNVTVHGAADNVGGLVGQLGGSTIEKSFVEGLDLTGDGSKTGGLVGYAVGPSSVSDSYAQGDVDGSTTVGGVIGQLGIGPSIAQQLYSDVHFIAAGSDVIGTVASGGSTSATFVASSPYLGNNTEAPLDSWDFTNVWYVRPGNYPGLRPLELPIRLCNQPTVTNTSVTVSCTSDPLLEGDPHWELKYGYDDQTATIPLTTQAGQSFSVTIPNLLPGTDYAVWFRYVDTVGTSQWGKVQATTSGGSDTDSDGTSNEQEALGPNNGDADGDGVADYTQANVTSFKNFITGNYIVLKTACTDNYNVQLGREASSPADATYDYPAGLLGFIIRGCASGATTPVNVYYYGSYNPASYVARIWQHGNYTALTGAMLASTTIAGQPALHLSYNLTDGGAFDSDGTADGNIDDPVGIAQSTVTAPNTGVREVSPLPIVLFTFFGLSLLGLARKTHARKSHTA